MSGPDFFLFCGKIKQRVAVWLLENGTYKAEVFKDKADLAVFTAALTMVNWKGG